MGGRISAREARNALSKAKAERPELFASAALYAHAQALLAALPLPPPSRRLVHSLFDRVSFSDKSFEGIGRAAAAAGTVT
jgi:hypothetical protein